jgi:uncharacterized tellurite resistance protein B-like protein
MKTISDDVLFDEPDTCLNADHPNSPQTTSPELAMLARSFASVLLAQAVADGDVHAVEIRRIERILRKTFYIGHADTERFVREALDDSAEIGSLAFENSLETLRERFLPHQRQRFIEALMEVAESDGYVVEKELIFSAYVRKRLGIERVPG